MDSEDKKGKDVASSKRSHSVRVWPVFYIDTILPAIFFSALCLYFQSDILAIVFLATATVSFIGLLTDRITLGPSGIVRTGFVFTPWCRMTRRDAEMKFVDIEQVETKAVRGRFKGGEVVYGFRVTVLSRGRTFVFGDRAGSDFVSGLLTNVADDALDVRSREIRDNLLGSLTADEEADEIMVPSSEYLDSQGTTLERSLRESSTASDTTEPLISKSLDANAMRSLGNRLKLAGSLLRSFEVFRRALKVHPKDSEILLDASKCLFTIGQAKADSRLRRRASAMLRLAEQRAEGKHELLARIGEMYFLFGHRERARNAFRNAADTVEENFRALRGLAEISFREGKLAHVILMFRAASRIAPTDALRRWTEGEAEYFDRLNGDEDYLFREVRRIQLTHFTARARMTLLPASLLGIPAILIGLFADSELTSQIGWAFSGISFALWWLSMAVHMAFGRRTGGER
jgi:tetratricopeptide (TPR) repeat protein